MSSADQREVGVEDLIRRALPGVRALSPYEPGKPISELEREYGVRDIIKLASNESPLGASPTARAAAAEALAELALYPDGNGYELKQVLARRQRLDPRCLTLGNGSNDLLELISRVFLAPGRNAVYSQYAFAIYALVTQAAGAEGRCVAAHPLGHPQPLGHDLAAMAAQVDVDTAVVFLANPNNPTGTWFDRAEFERFMQAVPPQTLVVLDEAYFEYVDALHYPSGRDYLADHPNLIVIRTFSKAYGLAALRVGYAMSHPAIADLLNRVRQPFNVNQVAQQAALAALADEAHLAQALAINRQGLRQLAQGLDALGLERLPSVANFIAVCVPQAGKVYEALLRAGIIVRPLAGYRMPDYLRITVGLPEQNARLLTALGRILPELADGAC
jgi:histidinol-phosphate aminotransferase